MIYQFMFFTFISILIQTYETKDKVSAKLTNITYITLKNPL